MSEEKDQELTPDADLDASEEELEGEAVSLDDFYLPTAQLRGTWRGHPGTHDLDALERALRAFRDGERDVRVPVYDKRARHGRGDRAGWRTLRSEATTLLVEGWCVGFMPTGDGDALDAHVAAYAARIHPLLDALMVLRPPNDVPLSDLVHRWRAEAEPAGGMREDELHDFVSHYLPVYDRYLLALYAAPPLAPCLTVTLSDDRAARSATLAYDT